MLTVEQVYKLLKIKQIRDKEKQRLSSQQTAGEMAVYMGPGSGKNEETELGIDELEDES